MAVKVAAATGTWSAAGTWSDTNGTGDQLAGSSSTSIPSISMTYSTAVTLGNVNVKGCLFQIASRAASPSGTLTIVLRNVTGATNVASVTVNVSDIDAGGNGWLYFHWGTQNLSNANQYAIGFQTSVTTQLSYYYLSVTSAPNVAYVLSAASGAAPAAGDTVFVLGQYTGAGTSNSFTVTQDVSAGTAYAAIHVGKFGTLTWATAANTYIGFTSIFNVWAGGTHNQGTSGTPIGAAYTSILECAGANATYNVLAGGADNRYGASKTYYFTMLNASAASAQANLTTADNVSADWAQQSWDKLIAITATTVNATSQSEERTISTISGTTITVTANLTNTHSVSNTGGKDLRVPIVLLGRNCILRGTAASTNFQATFGTTAAVNWSWCAFTSAGSFGASAKGFNVNTGSGGSCTIDHCSFYDIATFASVTYLINFINASAASALQYCSFYNMNIGGAGAVIAFGTGATITGNVIVAANRAAGAFTIASSNNGNTPLNPPVAFTNNRIYDAHQSNSGVAFNTYSLSNAMTISGNVIAVCGGYAHGTLSSATFSVANGPSAALPAIIGTSVVWTNSGGSYGYYSAANILFSSLSEYSSETNSFFTNDALGTLLNCSLANATYLATGLSMIRFIAIGTTFGTYTSMLGGGQLTHVLMYGCTLSATNMFTSLTGYAPWAGQPHGVFSYNHNAVTGAYRYWGRNHQAIGQGEASDTTHGEHTTCLALTPNIASNAIDNNCEHWMWGTWPAISGTAPQPTFRLKSFGSWNGKAYITTFFKGRAVAGPTEITSSINASTFTTCSITGSNPGESGVYQHRLTYSGTTGGLYLDAEGDAAIVTVS